MSKSKHTLEKIQALLPSLEASDKRILAALLTQQGVEPAQDRIGPVDITRRALDSDSDTLLSAMNTIFNNMGMGEVPPYSVLPVRDKKAVVGAAKVITHLLEEEDILTQAYLSKMSMLVLGVTVQHLREVNVPVSLRSVAEASPRYAGIFDKAFPGYLDSGLLPVLLDSVFGSKGQVGKGV